MRSAAGELLLSEMMVIEGLLWLTSNIASRNKLIQLIVIVMTIDHFDRFFPRGPANPVMIRGVSVAAAGLLTVWMVLSTATAP